MLSTRAVATCTLCSGKKAGYCTAYALEPRAARLRDGRARTLRGGGGFGGSNPNVTGVCWQFRRCRVPLRRIGDFYSCKFQGRIFAGAEKTPIGDVTEKGQNLRIVLYMYGRKGPS